VHSLDLVVFDLAGTTIEDDGAVLRALIATGEEYDLPGSSQELNALMGMNKREVFGMLAARQYPDDAATADRIADEALHSFVERMRAEYDRHLVPIDGAEATFLALHERGVKVAIDTGFERGITDLIVNRLDWPGRLVDVVVCSSDVPVGRPAPYMIFHAMQHLGVTNVRAVAKVGDSPADLEEGMNAGCGEVIGVLSGAHTVETLGPLPHTRILKSVADFLTLFD
jgi:phosphonatase-like hydrolase